MTLNLLQSFVFFETIFQLYVSTERECYYMQGKKYHYQSGKVRKTIAMIIMIIMVMISVATFVLGIIELSMFAGMDRNASVEMMTDAAAITVLLESIANVLWLVTYIGFAIVFLMWMNRVYKNLLSVSGIGLRHTPGWAVVWYFIPIANLFKPYGVMKETYLATMHADGTKDWKDNEGSGVVLIWWLFYVIGNIISGRSSSSTFRTIGDYKTDAILVLISETMLIISGICLLVIMHRITKKQDNELLDRMNGDDSFRLDKNTIFK